MKRQEDDELNQLKAFVRIRERIRRRLAKRRKRRLVEKGGDDEYKPA